MWREDQEPGLSNLRNVSLFAGERVEQMLGERGALADEPPHEGPLLALTNRRLLLFNERDGERETTIVPLEQIQGVQVRTSPRSSKPLIQGVALMVTALVAYLLVGNFVVEGVLIPAIVGTVIGIIGVYMVLRYLFWEEESNLVFRLAGWCLSFPHRARRHDDALSFVHRLFALKAAVQHAGLDSEARAASTRAWQAHPSPAATPTAQEEAAPKSDERQQVDMRPSPGGEDDARKELADPGIGDDVQA